MSDDPINTPQNEQNEQKTKAPTTQTNDTTHNKNTDTDQPALTAKPQWRSKFVQTFKLLGVLSIGIIIGILGWPDSPSTPTPKTHDHANEASSQWTCSMHPQVRSDKEGTCPICGMDLVPASSLKSSGEDHSAGEIRLTPRAKTLARLRTTTVKPQDLAAPTRELLGRVAPNESTERTITPWIAGRIDRLYVTTTGARVGRGQPLAKLYSPSVYTAHQELLAAKKQALALKKADPYAQDAAKSQLEAAKQKLRLLGISSRELTRMLASTSPWSHITIRSTVSGTILKRMVNQGQYVNVGQPLYKVADLSRIWVMLDAYESDLPHIQKGQSVTLTFEALPQTQINGTVDFIDPTLNPKTKTAQVRVAIDNKSRQFKPGMYARATFKKPLTSPGDPLPLLIPRTAPLFAGRRALVYVEKASDNEGSVYIGKPVKLGALVGDQYIVLAGLQRGDVVVTHGAFAIDSDLQIRGGLSLLSRPDDTVNSPTDNILNVSPQERAQLKPVVSGYLDVQELLADDKYVRAIARAKAWKQDIDNTTLKRASVGIKSAWTPIRKQMLIDATALALAKDIQSARKQFQFLTTALEEILLRFGNPIEQPVRLAYCPMAFNNKGGQWFQRADKVDNVYYGNQMRMCGEIRKTLDPKQHYIPTTQADKQ